LAELEKSRKEFDARIPSTLITTAVPPRMVRILRAAIGWTTAVSRDAGVPSRAQKPASSEQPGFSESRTTLDSLASTASDCLGNNPLTARVFVNRLWKLFFGAGLSRKLDDLVPKGLPSHPLLLDHLATQFIDSGWT